MSQQHEHPLPTQPTRTATDAPGRFVNPARLVCAGCGEQVRPEPPGYWRLCDGFPAPGFSHPDGSALCRRLDGTVGEPIEIEALR